jgi:NADH-quinone oxidoreductase subunit E
MLRGSEALMDVCRSKIHHEQFHTNQAGTLSWEEVECLGACVNAPMVMIFKDTFEDLTPERLGEIIDAFEAGKGATVTPGPQNGRVYSAPISGLTTLKDETAVLKAARDREAGARPTEPATATGARVPPSKAAKPKTYAAETNNTVKSPSPVKTSPKAEAAVSASTPRPDPVAANKAEPAVEAVTKQRKRKSGDMGVSAAKAPELLRGEPIGPAGKRVKGEPAAPKGAPSPEGKKRL